MLQSISRSSNITLVHIPKGCALIPQRHLLNNAHSSTVHNSQNLETTYMPLDCRKDKENVLHLHNGVLLSGKKTMTSCDLKANG